MWDRVSRTDRVALVGTTGSGKTTLLAALAATRPYVLLYDPKGDSAWDGGEWVVVREAARLPKRYFPPRVRYHPYPELLRDRDELESVFWYAYHAGNMTLIVDEGYMATLGGTWTPTGLHACIAQGRSRGVGVWVATQRPHKIPQIVLSEAEHWYVFRLNHPIDRNAVWQWTGIPPRNIAALPKKAWYYVHMGEIYGPHTLDLGGEHGSSTGN